jgi:S-(hydroxymethyl)glutathione dehydrogenase / alcohol dehydrogenase
MRAAVCRAFGAPLVVEEVEIAPPGPGAVAARIEACAICHSDIAYLDGDWGGALPAIYGHEAAGRVTAVGSGVRGVAPGDRVLVTLIRACGACPSCAGGAPTSCDHAWDAHPSPIRDAAGVAIRQGMNAAAFAETVVVDASQLAALPDDLPAELACLLACGVLTGVGAVVNVARPRPGAAIAVVGAGGVGINAIQGAGLAGAGRVIAVDINPGRLEDARHFGATDGVPAGPDAGTAIRDLTGGRGVEVAVVTAGAPAAIAAAADYLAPGGALVVVGMLPTGTTVPYDPTDLAVLNRRILGARMGQAVLARDIPWLIGEWRRGRLKLAELVAGRYPLEEINAAVAASRAGIAGRNVIVFGDPH